MTPMFFIRLSCLNLVFFPFPRAIVNNFVTERNSAEVMAVGLNAVRWVSTLFISDPGSRIPDLGSRISDPGSRIPDPINTSKRGEGK